MNQLKSITTIRNLSRIIRNLSRIIRNLLRIIRNPWCINRNNLSFCMDHKNNQKQTIPNPIKITHIDISNMIHWKSIHYASFNIHFEIQIQPSSNITSTLIINQKDHLMFKIKSIFQFHNIVNSIYKHDMIDYDAIWLSQVYAINRFFI